MQEAKVILVVEDERVVALDLQRSLQNLGYRVPATASSAEQALRLAEELRPDLILMDIRIAGDRDGIETAIAFRSRLDVPVVYLTAFSDAATLERAHATEPHGYLLKPVKNDQLRAVVEVALHKHDVERNQRAREARLAATLASIGDGVVSSDEAGRIVFMNPVAERLTGWSGREAAGHGCWEVVRLKDAGVDAGSAAATHPVHRALRARGPFEGDRVLVNRTSDRDRVVSDITTPILGEQGELMGAVMAFRDAPDRRPAAAAAVGEGELAGELDRLRRLAVSRESRMFELKTEIAGLRAQLREGGLA